MRIELDADDGWPAGVRLLVEPLRSCPYDRAAWRRRIALWAGVDPEIPFTASATRCGFPMEIAETATCVVALYTFIDHVAAAIALAVDPATLAHCRAEILARLRDARPDWTGPEIVCLAELWQE